MPDPPSPPPARTHCKKGPPHLVEKTRRFQARRPWTLWHLGLMFGWAAPAIWVSPVDNGLDIAAALLYLLGILIYAWAAYLSTKPNPATPLMMAAANDRAAVVSGLLEAGADPNRGSLEVGGETALMFAATQASDETVSALLSHGADPNAMHALGCTPLSCAYLCCRCANAAALRRAGASLGKAAPIMLFLGIWALAIPVVGYAAWSVDIAPIVWVPGIIVLVGAIIATHVLKRAGG